jgi:hypothetical protein
VLGFHLDTFSFAPGSAASHNCCGLDQSGQLNGVAGTTSCSKDKVNTWGASRRVASSDSPYDSIMLGN